MSNQRRFALIGRGFGSDSFDEYTGDLIGGMLLDSSEINFTYTDATPSITAALIDASITFARLQNADALSVLGRAANTSGVLNEITASADGQILHRNGTALQFGLTLPGAYIFTGLNEFQNHIRLGTKVGTSAGTYYRIDVPAISGAGGFIVGFSVDMTNERVLVGGAGNASISGVGVTAIGPGALASLTSGNGVGIGQLAGGSITTGNGNFALGSLALFGLTTGASNIGIGSSAGFPMATGASNNVLIGGSSGGGVTTENVAIGVIALSASGTVSQNVVIGFAALSAGPSGVSRAVAIGNSAGRRIAADTIAIGYQAGSNTVATGQDRSVLLGTQAGVAGTGADTVLIGYRVGFTNNPGANALWIHNADSSTPLVQGDFSTRIFGVNGHARLLRDNDELQLGAGQDLRLYHNGTNNIVDTVNGALITQVAGTERVRVDNTRVTFAVPPQKPNYTFAGLPGGALGDTALVTDALAPVFGAAVAGGGAVTTPVYYNGAAWIVG